MTSPIPGRRVCLVVIGLLAAGCATVPYRAGMDLPRTDTLALRPGEAQIERGRPHAVLDGAGWVFGLPARIILWDMKVDNHRIGTNTEAALARYLGDNDLGGVKVRLNQYAPGGEWSRLFRNRRVGGGWRYTVGVLSEVLYTVLPGRLLAGLVGGDHYNPYTDTINLYSDHPAIALHEGGHAKDFAQVKYPGSYAALGLLPLASLYFEEEATADALGYLRVHGSEEEEKAAYRILYPAYGTYVGGGLGVLAPPAATACYFGSVAAGHVFGRVKAAGVDERRADEAAGHAAAPASTP